MATPAELRAYINNNMIPGQKASIDGSEMVNILLELCNLYESGQSWVPAFSLVPYGPKILFKIVDWTGGQGAKPTVNVYLATAGGTTANPDLAMDVRGAQGNQGLPGSGVLTGVTAPTDSQNLRYYPILELPASGDGSYDFADIEIIVKPWDNQQGGQTKIWVYVANRGQFVYEWSANNLPPAPTSVLAYRQSDGRTILYLRLNNNFRSFSVRVPNYNQVSVYPTLTPINNVSGTLLLDTASPGVYPPRTIQSYTFPAWFINNGDGNNPYTNNVPGQGLLALGTNLLPGFTEVALMNANTSVGDSALGGFSFWQMASSATKRLLMYLNAYGRLGIGTASQTSTLHIKGENGYSQFRLELNYTPTGTGDPNGQPGDICSDDNYLYKRTIYGWRRLGTLNNF